MQTEEDLKHGAIKEHPFTVAWRRASRPKWQKVGGAAPFDWTKGYDSADLTGLLNIKNQFSAFECGGTAAAQLLRIISKKQLGIDLPELSEKSIYSIGRYPFGGGMTIGSLQDVIENTGAALESAVPSHKPDGTTDEAFASDVSWSTKEQLIEAFKRAGWKPVTVPTDIDSIASYSEMYGAVIIMFGASNNGTMLSAYPQFSGKKDWRHYDCVKSAKMSPQGKAIDVYQSWGNSVGDAGIQHFTEQWFNGAVEDAFTFIPRSAEESKVAITVKLLNLMRELMKQLLKG